MSRTMAIRKFLKVLIACLFAILLMITAILSWIIFTESGTRQLFSTLGKYELLSYESLQGSIGDGLKIKTLNIETSSANVSITELNLSADWSKLFYSKLLINTLSAHKITINLIKNEQETSQDKAFNLDFLNQQLTFIPLEIDLQQLSVQQLNIIDANQTYSLSNIALATRVDQQGISALQLSMIYEKTSLQLRGNVTLAPKLAMNLRLNWQSTLPDGSVIDGESHLKGNNRRLDISHQSSGSLVSQIDIKATNWLNQPQLDIHGTIKRLTWPLNSTTPPQLSTIELNAQGDLSSLKINITGQLQLHEDTRSTFEILADLSPTKLDISKLQLNDNSGGSAIVSGYIDWLDDMFSWRGLLSLDQFNGQVIEPLSPQKLNGQLAIKGSYDSQLLLDITSTDLQGILQKRAFDAKINVQLQGDKIDIQQLQASIGDNQLTLSGQLEKLRFNLKFDSQITDLNELLPASKGSIKTSGLLTGTAQKPTLKAQLQAQQLSLYGLSAADMKLAIDLRDGVFIKAANQLNALGLRYQSTQIDRLNLSAVGAWLAPSLRFEAANSELQISAQSDLQLNKPDLISALLNQLQLEGETIGVWQLEQPAKFQSADLGWSVTPLCLLDNDGRVCVKAAMTAGKLNASLNARQLPLSLLNSSGLLSTPITGQLDITASVTGDRQQQQGQLSLRQSHVNIPLVLSAGDDANTQLTIAGLVSEINLNNGSLNGSVNARLNDTGSLSSEFKVDQLLSEHSPLEARVDYNIPDLQSYAVLIPDIDTLTGELEGYIKLDNSLQEPHLSVFTRLNIPQIYINPLSIEWTDLNAEITTLSGSKQQLKASVTAGDGQLNLEGTLTFTSIDNWLSELHIQGENALLMDQKDRRVLASPDMHITATPTHLNVEGQLRIPAAKLIIKSSPNRLALTSDAVIHTDGNDPANDVEPYQLNLNLAVLLGDKVTFEAYGLKTDVTGRLDLSKQYPGALLGNGELNLVNGAYQAYGQDLIIERGVIRFTGLLNHPEIDLTASRTVKNVVAGLKVNGPVDNLRSRLYSRPPLPDSEILSYIIRGKPLDSASAADQNALANALLAYSISQSTPITSKLTALSGLDEIGLEAEDGVESLGFTLGKYITPRLYARYGIGVIDKLSKVFLQYQLSDKFYLETESGQGQSVDLMYRSR